MENPTGVFRPDDLYAGDFPEIRDYRTIPAGTGLVKRGTILSDDGRPANGGALDSILLEDADATDGDVLCVVALTGEFNVNALRTGSVIPAEAYKTELRKLSIFVRHPAP